MQKSPLVPSLCPCCQKDVNDPLHIPIGKFFLVIKDAMRVTQAQGGSMLELRGKDKRPIIITDGRTMKSVNIVHHHLKLDGMEGRPRVDTIEDLIPAAGWLDVKVAKLKEFLGSFKSFETLFTMVNKGNPTQTPEMQIDLIAFLAVIRDSGWAFYEELQNSTLSTLFDKKGHMQKMTQPALTRPIYVGGGVSGKLSFPTYFARNEAQLKTYQLSSWSDYLLLLGDAGNVGLFLLCIEILMKDNHYWADLLWETHRRLNDLIPSRTLPAIKVPTGGISSFSAPKELKCKSCGALIPSFARFCNKCGQKM